jgi:hypothetical protein
MKSQNGRYLLLRGGRAAEGRRTRATPETKPSLLPDSPPSGRESSSSPAEATPAPNKEALGPGGTASESGGIDIGGAAGSPSGKGATAGRAGSAVNSEVSVGTRSGQHDTSGYRDAAGTRPGGGTFQPAIPTPPLAIPGEAFRGLPFSRSARFTLKSIVMFFMDTICGTVAAYQPTRFA